MVIGESTLSTCCILPVGNQMIIVSIGNFLDGYIANCSLLELRPDATLDLIITSSFSVLVRIPRARILSPSRSSNR